MQRINLPLAVRAKVRLALGFLLLLPISASLAAAATVVSSQERPTLVVAEHRAARLDALYSLQGRLEESLGIELKVVEYPAPDKDYFTKLVTELRAGNAPDVFTIPRDLQLDDLAAAGYLADLTDDVAGWDGYAHLPDLIKSLARASFDNRTYVVPSIIAVEQLYFRKDLLEQAGISTAQPRDWQDLLQRAREIRAKTGQYALLFPAGLTWGNGSFTEGLRYLLAGHSDYQMVDNSGRYDLSSAAVTESLRFYQSLVQEELMPVVPLLNPEPWVIPKYEMFPAGQLMITTCGTWCRLFDWGPGSRNPLPDIEQNLGVWRIPTADGGEPFVLASMVYPWAVNQKSRRVELAKELALALGSVDVAMEFAARLGDVPARFDADRHPDYDEMPWLVSDHKLLSEARALRTTVGSSAMMAGAARATEAILTGREDAEGAKELFHDYVEGVLGEKAVRR